MLKNAEPVISSGVTGGPLHVSGWLQSAKGTWEQLSISTRPITKTAAAAVTLGTGASLGPEVTCCACNQESGSNNSFTVHRRMVFSAMVTRDDVKNPLCMLWLPSLVSDLVSAATPWLPPLPLGGSQLLSRLRPPLLFGFSSRSSSLFESPSEFRAWDFSLLLPHDVPLSIVSVQ